MGRRDATTERIMLNRASRYSQNRLISEENAAVAWHSLRIEKTTSLSIEHVQKQRGMKRAMLRHVCARQQNRTTSRRLSESDGFLFWLDLVVGACYHVWSGFAILLRGSGCRIRRRIAQLWTLCADYACVLK